MGSFPSLLVCILLAADGGKVPGVTAETWLNRLTLRPLEPQACIVLFFDGKPTPVLGKEVERLNKLSRKRDLMVLAVTAQREEVALKFIKQYRPRFPVGVQSSAYRAFRVKKFPSLLVLVGKKAVPFDEWVESGEIVDPGFQEVDQAIPFEEQTVEELQDSVAKAEAPDDLDALSVLRIRMEPQDFMRLCDEIEYNRGPSNPWWLGRVRYERHLGDPNIEEKQSDTSPARDAVQRARRDGTRKSGELVDLLKSKAGWSHDELMGLYTKHLGDEDDNLVYRFELAAAIGNLGNPAYVPSLLDMLETETDPNIRFRLAGAIDDIHDVAALPNLDVVHRLERQLGREEDIRWVRPMIEMTLQNLRFPPPDYEDGKP